MRTEKYIAGKTSVDNMIHLAVSFLDCFWLGVTLSPICLIPSPERASSSVENLGAYKSNRWTALLFTEGQTPFVTTYITYAYPKSVNRRS